MKMSLVNPAMPDFSAEDISLTTICTWINERTDHECSIIDLTFHRKNWREHLSREIRSEQPDIIGVSTNSLYMNFIKELMREIKTNYDLPIILGGYHASINSLETFALEDCDAICIGDSEPIIGEYLTRLEKGQSVNGLKGVWQKEKGREIRNGKGIFFKDIESSPVPDWDYWKDFDKYLKYIQMLYHIGKGGRGCPFVCSFCSARDMRNSVDGVYYRVGSPEKYVDELAFYWDKYRSRGLKVFQLFDQIFTANKHWLRRFTTAYKERGLAAEVPYSAFSRLDHIDEERAKMLAESNCCMLRVGVESANERVRNQIYHKDLKMDAIRKGFELCKKYQIGLMSFFILGAPTESKQDVEETIALAKELDATRAAFFVFKPFPKSEAARKLEEIGQTVDWSKANNITFGAVTGTGSLKPWQIEMYQRKAYVRILSKRIWDLLKYDGLGYFTGMSKYLYSGLQDGLDPKYLLTYYHIYGADHVYERFDKLLPPYEPRFKTFVVKPNEN